MQKMIENLQVKLEKYEPTDTHVPLHQSWKHISFFSVRDAVQVLIEEENRQVMEFLTFLSSD